MGYNSEAKLSYLPNTRWLIWIVILEEMGPTFLVNGPHILVQNGPH